MRRLRWAALAVMVVALGAHAAPPEQEPRNLRVSFQEATDSVTVRWVQPQQAQQVSPPITGYEVIVLVDGSQAATGSTGAAGREMTLDAPGPCGVAVTVSARVRAVNPAATWSPGPWGESGAAERFRPCAVVAPLAPSVTVQIDSTDAPTDPTDPPPTDTVPPSWVSDLRQVSGEMTLEWTQVPDGAGGGANYALRHGCPTMTGWAAAFPTEEEVLGDGEPGESQRHPITPERTPCEYRMTSYRGRLGSAVFAQTLSNIVTVVAPGDPVPPPPDDFALVGLECRMTEVVDWRARGFDMDASREAQFNADVIVTGDPGTWTYRMDLLDGTTPVASVVRAGRPMEPVNTRLGAGFTLGHFELAEGRPYSVMFQVLGDADATNNASMTGCEAGA